MSKPLSPTLFTLLSLLSLAPLARAHGFLSQVTIDGKPYQGNVPNNYQFPSPIRLIDDVSPVKGATNPNIVCGQNAQNAEVVATANPGSTVEFAWIAGDDSQHWPHNTGPLITYMAECTGTTCDKFDASQAQWFKIDQVGKEQNSDTWVVADTLFQGKPYTLTLPQNIAPGDYLVRHEILALHLGTEMGGAEFYPSCTQVRIGGNGNGTPSASDLVSFPGAYSDSDPGIFVPTVFNPGANYTSFPGPAVAGFLKQTQGNGDVPDPNPAPAATSTPSAPSAPPAVPSPSPAYGGDSGSCSEKKRMVKRHGRFSRSH